MRLSTFSLLIFIALTQLVTAIYIPSFKLQEQNPFIAEKTLSTKLIEVCGDSTDLLTIDYIKLNPDPPVKGENLHIEFKGYLKDTVGEGAYVELVVKWGVVQLVKKTFDLCEEITKIDEKCPLEKGDLVISKDVELPKTIPPGKYTVFAEVYTVDDERVTCLKGITTFPRH